MAKPNKTKASASKNKKKTRLWQALLAVVVLGGMVSAYVLSNRDSSSGTDNSAADKQASDVLPVDSPLRDRLAIPASPRNPRPVTMNPDGFNDPEVKAAYAAAKDVPEVLEHLSCYCGCFKEAGHRNNLDCFHDSHGTQCGLCRAIAIEGQREYHQGIPVEQIKRNIDERWAPPVTH